MRKNLEGGEKAGFFRNSEKKYKVGKVKNHCS
jgi:hypothetical protein